MAYNLSLTCNITRDFHANARSEGNFYRPHVGRRTRWEKSHLDQSLAECMASSDDITVQNMDKEQ